MTTITIEDIQGDVLGYLQRVEAGETLLIVRADEPVAEIKPIARDDRTQQLRPVALCAGEFSVPDDFDLPLPDDILSVFEGDETVT